MTDRPAFVLLEDGAWFPGTTARPIDPAFGEVVFTTNLTGYQETFTDPSYLGQIVVMTAPMIGNYGVNVEDMESARPQISGVVVRELSRHSVQLARHAELGRLAHGGGRARARGDRHPAADPPPARARRDARRRGRGPAAQPGAHGPASRLAVDGRARPGVAGHRSRERYTEGEGPHVVAYDYGMKRNIVRMLVRAGLPRHRGAGRDVGGRGASAKS